MTERAFQRVDAPERTDEERAIVRVAEAVHRMNEAVQRAVSSGLSVELVRVSRFHDNKGNWGDQVVPTIREVSESPKN
ncbi:MAG: hypothetical protein MI743_19775 [Sneathiellales bacterium]|nr:hypothetical protein [Sneathiellales bacterium]